MKKIIVFIFSVYSLGAVCDEPTEIRFCYLHFREEMATAAALVGNTQGYFAANGIKVKFVHDEKPIGKEEILKGTVPHKSRWIPRYLLNEIGLVQKTIRGECDVSVVGAEAFLFNKDNRNLQPLAVYLYGSQYDTHLLTGTRSGVTSVAGLKGKTIRIGRLPTYILLLKSLRDAGLSESDVQIGHGSPDILTEKLAQNDFGGVIAYNPTTPLLVASGNALVIKKNLFGTYLKPFIPSSALFTSKTVSENKKAALARFMTAFQSAAARISENPEDVIYELKSSLGNKLSYKFKPADIEKAASIMKIGQPFYFDRGLQRQAQSKVTASDVKAGFEMYRAELKALRFFDEIPDTDYIRSI